MTKLRDTPERRAVRRRSDRALVALCVLALIVVVAAVVADRVHIDNTVDGNRAGIGLDVAKSVVYVVAGLVGAVGAFLVHTVRRRRRESRERSDSARFTRLFTEAVNLLGADDVRVRVSGVLALADLTDVFPRRRQDCVGALCAVMRSPYQPPSSPLGEETGERRIARQRALDDRLVRRVIMDLIGARLRAVPVSGRSWHDCHLNLKGAVVDGGDWSGARFVDGVVDFEGAWFPSGRMSFVDAVVETGYVHFGDVAFAGAVVDFRGAAFRGGRVLFSGALFSGGRVDFGGSAFDGGAVAWWGATFAGTDVSFTGAAFIGGRADFWDATFCGGRVDFGGAVFTGGVVDLGAARLTGEGESAPLAPPSFGLADGAVPVGLVLPDGYSIVD
ncbi:pentapeptide repeat-containing protein [Stackebrandtia soli]|uniref:pentapeptide repeat-containing protein n=1 Tax=Stackebrandtia soli TaxID=1892856 RepID=UPI0039ED9C06